MTEPDVRIGKSNRHVVVMAGPWAIWLTIDSASRFPDVASVIRRSPECELHLDDSDRQTAFEFINQAVKSEDDPANVTVEFGPHSALRVKPDAMARSSEGVLTKSQCSGPGIAFALDRDQFARVLSFGLRHVSHRLRTGLGAS